MSIVYVAKGKEEGDVRQRLLLKLKKTVVPIGDVALYKSVPTPFPCAGALGNIDNYLYIFL